MILTGTSKWHFEFLFKCTKLCMYEGPRWLAFLGDVTRLNLD